MRNILKENRETAMIQASVDMKGLPPSLLVSTVHLEGQSRVNQSSKFVFCSLAFRIKSLIDLVQ